MNSSVRIPLMGELKHNSGTYYQFSNFGNSYIDNSITPTYYMALDLDLDLDVTNNILKSKKLSDMTIKSKNSLLSELLMKAYEAKIGTIENSENGNIKTYFESYLYNIIFSYIYNNIKENFRVYLDTETYIDEDTNIQNIKVNGKAYPFISDNDRALIDMPESPIKYIGVINAQGLHKYGNRVYSDIHVNIPAAHNQLGTVLPIRVIDEVELNRKSMEDMMCHCEITTEIPYLTATGESKSQQAIYDWDDAFWSYINERTIKEKKISEDKYSGEDERIKKLLLENNLKIDFDYLVENYNDYSIKNDEPTKVNFNTIVILGRDTDGNIIPCALYFASHFDENGNLASTSSKTDISVGGDDGNEYSVRLSTGVQVMQNIDTNYEANDQQSTTTDITELTVMAARLQEISDKLTLDLQNSGQWVDQLSYLIGNAYTIRRNVPYLVDYKKGKDSVKVWYVNGMNTGIMADGKPLSNFTDESDEDEKQDTPSSETSNQPYKAIEDECIYYKEIKAETFDGNLDLYNVYIPNSKVLHSHDYIIVTTPIETAFNPETSTMFKYISDLIANVMTSDIKKFEDVDDNKIFSIIYKIKNNKEDEKYIIVETKIMKLTDTFKPILPSGQESIDNITSKK